MFHILLVIISYICFNVIVYDVKTKREGGLTIAPSVLLFFSGIHIILLTVVYEQLLVHILLHNVHSYKGYILFSAIGSGLYMIFFFIGLMILGKLMECPLPNIWTILILIIALAANVMLITKATNLYYEEMFKNFGEDIFINFYKSLSETERPDTANTLLNLKWLVMIIPGIAYLVQILKQNVTTISDMAVTKNDEQI